MSSGRKVKKGVVTVSLGNYCLLYFQVCYCSAGAFHVCATLVQQRCSLIEVYLIFIYRSKNDHTNHQHEQCVSLRRHVERKLQGLQGELPGQKQV